MKFKRKNIIATLFEEYDIGKYRKTTAPIEDNRCRNLSEEYLVTKRFIIRAKGQIIKNIKFLRDILRDNFYNFIILDN